MTRHVLMPVQAPTRELATRRKLALRQWLIDHDERWLFVIAYVGLAVVLSIWISLFWLIVVVSAHGALECFRQHQLLADAEGDRPSTMTITSRVTWELKLDFALVLFALALAAYMNLILGAAGLGAASRLGVQTGARAAAWARGLRGVLLSVDDVAQIARAATVRRKTKQDEGQPAPIHQPKVNHSRSPLAGWRSNWSVGDQAAVWFGIGCLIALLLAPALTSHDTHSLLSLIGSELHPWPGFAE